VSDPTPSSGSRHHWVEARFCQSGRSRPEADSFRISDSKCRIPYLAGVAAIHSLVGVQFGIARLERCTLRFQCRVLCLMGLTNVCLLPAVEIERSVCFL
jgi:hypothetical protein